MAQLNSALFLRQLAKEVAELLPAKLGQLNTEPHGRILKLWYGEEKRIHYEVALHEWIHRIEIGLHCEAEQEQNELIRRGLMAELFEIKHRLGHQVEVEPWDRGWSRVYEVHPFQPLDEARAHELSARCAEFILAVQPMYEQIIATHPAQAPIRRARGASKR